MGMGDRLREKAFSQFLYLMRFEDSRSLASKNPLGLLGRMNNYAETILPYVTFNVPSDHESFSTGKGITLYFRC